VDIVVFWVEGTQLAWEKNMKILKKKKRNKHHRMVVATFVC
jgi:hypothetical protein